MELKTNLFQVLQLTTALHSDFINAVNNKGSKCYSKHVDFAKFLYVVAVDDDVKRTGLIQMI